MLSHAGDSAPFVLDNATSPSGESVVLPWNAEWIGGNANATVVITDNGTEVKRATGSGEFTLNISCGNHQLEYATFINGTKQVETYTAEAEWTHIAVETKAAKAATCTNTGWTHEVKCSRCDAVLEASTVLPNLGGHVEVETKAANAATCTKTGWTHEVKCSRCNAVLEASTTIPALGHAGSITKPAVEPTSSEPGLTAEITCKRCGKVLQSQTMIPALGYVRNVTARQLWPHKKVEICYEVADDIGDAATSALQPTITVRYGSTTTTATSSCVYGDTACSPGIHRVVWDFEDQSIAINQSSTTFTVSYASVSGASGAVAVNTSSSVRNNMSVGGTVNLGYSPFADGEVKIQIDGALAFSSTNSGVFAWQPLTLGSHVVKHISGGYEWTRVVNVTELAGEDPSAPNPPPAEDPNISITPTTATFGTDGGTGEFTVLAGTQSVWNVRSNVDWISVTVEGTGNGEQGTAGIGEQRVLFTVAPLNEVLMRSGVITAAGKTFTVNQTGRRMKLNKNSEEYDYSSNVVYVVVNALSSTKWSVAVDASWMSIVDAGSGKGAGSVTLAMDENLSYNARTGTVEIGTEMFTVTQLGRYPIQCTPYSPITYENLRGATNPNPATYRECTLVSFQNPGALTGYTFAGWTPSQITADMTGAQTVLASWTANSYSIAYNPNGGSGTMEVTAATYDSEATVATNGFTWAGHVFAGWATNETGDVIYAAGQPVTNLTAQSSGVVTLYAVWEPLVVATPTVTPGDGTVFAGDSCTVTITCATEGASIYYSPKGATPRLTDAYLYTGPFAITDTATIKAIAVLDGVRSGYVTATITKRGLALGEAASADATAAALSWTTGGDAQWTPVGDETTTSGLAAQSGAIGNASGEDFSTTWLQTEVSGAGTISFRWKVDCEWDDSGDMTWDRVVFNTNGVEAARMDGTSGWEELSFTFADAVTHTLRWTFMKDDYNEEVFADRAWVSGFTWTPSAPPPDPIPEISGDADVAGALAGSADVRLSGHIKTAAEYNAYRGWVNAKGLDHQTVKSSSRAWFSYAIGANGLVEKAFRNDDVTIDSLETESSGPFAFKVNVKDVMFGTGATAENLATVFDVQGAASLLPNSFSSDNVTVSLGVSADGKLSVAVTPKVAGGTFFVRVRMHADGDEATEDESGTEPVLSTVAVTFDANGGIGGTTRTVVAGESVGTLPTVSRYGYAFGNWWTETNGGTQVSAATVVTDDVTYYAHWTANTYLVTYNPGANGSGAQQTATKTHGVSLTLIGATFTRSGYTQTGWATSDGGTKAYDLGASYTSDAAITLYPYWVADPGPDTLGGVQLWENGPYWAECNVGERAVLGGVQRGCHQARRVRLLLLVGRHRGIYEHGKWMDFCQGRNEY